jgi:chromosome segregation ATPase
MRRITARQLAVLLVVIIIGGLAFVDAGAQGRKRRPRRVTRATATPSPSPDEALDPTDPRILSTAEQGNATTSKSTSTRAKASPTPTPETEQEQLRRTITDLSGQVNKLHDKLNQMEEQQRSMFDLERLSRAEQRAETFRSQLREVQAKETDLQIQLDQLEYALQPEQIERTVAVFGTTHPEVARDQRKKQLENQRVKVKAQFEQLEQSRVRLETAIANADAEVDKLQRQMDLGNQQLDQPVAPTPTPSPVEIPPNY